MLQSQIEAAGSGFEKDALIDLFTLLKVFSMSPSSAP